MSMLRRVAVVAVSTVVVTAGYVATATGAFATLVGGHP